MAGSITVVKAIHFASWGMEQLLNFLRNSLALFRQCLIWLSPLPSGDNMTPRVLLLVDGETRSRW